ncbi:MAG: carboxylating nicotinate-nucleotide diphosphorylase [Candidatus Dormibacteria bacterium]
MSAGLPAGLSVLVERALREDVGTGDITSRLTVDESLPATAEMLVKEAGVVAGLPVAAEVFRQCGECRVSFLSEDGANLVNPPVTVMKVEGPARALLTAERTALNFVQHLSGVATATARCVALVEGSGCVVTDTRKTVPGLRGLEKYAVQCGGGVNYRQGLFDAVLIKNNHIDLAGGVEAAFRRAAEGAPPGMMIQVEVRDLVELEAALAAGATNLLLDNMPPARLAEAVRLVAGRAVLEASGGITPDNLAEVAATGVNRASIGWLTHSARALDVSLRIRRGE